MPFSSGHRFLAALTLALIGGACGRSAVDSGASPRVTPQYNEQTGRLERLTSDRDGDGIDETTAVMDGAVLERIEIDKTHDGKADRFEYYERTGTGDGATVVIVRAEEKDAAGRVMRTERYEAGVIRSVEEDTDGDGRIDKWESYRAGTLSRVDLDLTGDGKPDRRITYGVAGRTIEADPDGDGVFEPMRSSQQ